MREEMRQLVSNEVADLRDQVLNCDDGGDDDDGDGDESDDGAGNGGGGGGGYYTPRENVFVCFLAAFIVFS